jgi:pimeloyl-ACP methyl ester carboxylesterase
MQTMNQQAKRRRRAVLAFWMSVCVLGPAVGQTHPEVEHIEIDPSALHAQALKIHGSHLASVDRAATPRHRLAVFLSGTGGIAATKVDLLDVLARDGYHAIALDYPNTVVAAKFRPSKDRHAFDGYRRAIAFGGRVDETLTVAPASSIEARISAALRHLATTRSAEGWSEYTDRAGVVWDKLILLGHSQGAGHAAYLAQARKVAKVLVIAGPQDYLTELNQPAPWLSAASLTPRERYRVLLHRDDEYDVKLQIAANRALLGPTAPEPVRFAADSPTKPVAPAILISERSLEASELAVRAQNPAAPIFHMSLARPAYAATWLYLLAH